MYYPIVLALRILLPQNKQLRKIKTLVIFQMQQSPRKQGNGEYAPLTATTKEMTN